MTRTWTVNSSKPVSGENQSLRMIRGKYIRGRDFQAIVVSHTKDFPMWKANLKHKDDPLGILQYSKNYILNWNGVGKGGTMQTILISLCPPGQA